MLLVLDLDDTLVDSGAAYRVALAAIGLAPDAPDYLAARARVKERMGPGHVGARNRLLYLKELADAACRFSAGPVLGEMNRYERALEREVARQWRDLGRPRLMEELRGIAAIAVATNENARTQLLKLRAMDPDGRFFPCVVTSEEVGVEKPAPRVLEEVLRRTGRAPRDCVVVGDSVADDVEPALRAGMRAVLTREFVRGAVRPPPGVPTVDRLDQLPGALRP